jgi:predicted DNA-binding protein
MRDLSIYKTGAVNTQMGMNRSTSVMLPAELYARLDAIVKRKNKNKAVLLRPLIKAYVEQEEAHVV